MSTYTITWEDPTGQSTTGRWTSQHLFDSIAAASVWAQEDRNANKRPVAIEEGGAMSIELTDREVAALIDSLAFMRDHLHDLRAETPNVDSALGKIKMLMTPATFGLRIEALP